MTTSKTCPEACAVGAIFEWSGQLGGRGMHGGSMSYSSAMDYGYEDIIPKEKRVD